MNTDASNIIRFPSGSEIHLSKKEDSNKYIGHQQWNPSPTQIKAMVQFEKIAWNLPTTGDTV